MNLKYSPCKSSHDTLIAVTAESTITIDGEDYEFDDSVIWPDISEQTDGRILEAHRESGELYITVRRFYTGSCSGWDTAEFHEVAP